MSLPAVEHEPLTTTGEQSASTRAPLRLGRSRARALAFTAAVASLFAGAAACDKSDASEPDPRPDTPAEAGNADYQAPASQEGYSSLADVAEAACEDFESVMDEDQAETGSKIQALGYCTLESGNEVQFMLTTDPYREVMCDDPDLSGTGVETEYVHGETDQGSYWAGVAIVNNPSSAPGLTARSELTGIAVAADGQVDAFTC